MMARRGAIGLLVAGASAVLSGCGLFGGNSYRFRMTVEVETPQGVRSGSSVYEVYADKRFALTSEEAEISDGLRGQALVVDLPEGPIFVLLKEGASGLYLYRAVTVALSGRMFRNLPDLIAMVASLGRAFGGAKAELLRKDWPLMVRFKDINDPKSVERVDPDTIGVKRIVVETTSDDVTTGIQNQLRWLTNEGLTLDPGAGPTTNPTFAQTIRQSEFGTEIGK